MSEESILVRDMIFPLGLCRKVGAEEVELVEFLGTGFLIGNKNYALTAQNLSQSAVLLTVCLNCQPAKMAYLNDKKREAAASLFGNSAAIRS